MLSHKAVISSYLGFIQRARTMYEILGTTHGVVVQVQHKLSRHERLAQDKTYLLSLSPHES